MKIGCCVNMIASGPDRTGTEWIELLRELEFDYVELPMAEMLELGAKEQSGIAERLRELDFPCLCNNNLFPVSFRLTGEECTSKRRIADYIKRAFSLMNVLGSKTVVFGSGPAKKVPEGFSRERAYDQLVQLGHMIGRLAEEYDVYVALEPLNRMETNIINSFREANDLMRDINEDRIRLLVDYYHLKVEQEREDNIFWYGTGVLRHVHFSEPKGRQFPQPKDAADYRFFFNALRAAGYDDTLSLEAYSLGHSVREDLRKGLLTIQTCLEKEKK